MDVVFIPALKDNYIWTIVDSVQNSIIVIDPGDAKVVLNFLNEHQYNLKAILLTHHHWDHTNGVSELLQHYKVAVYGSAIDNVSGISHHVFEPQEISFETFNLQLKVLNIPGHTLGHVAYYGNDMLFSGDTLFSAGCGKVFEGTAQEMYDSLQKLKSLPAQTKVYCGHEYTYTNLMFAKEVEPENEAILQKIETIKPLIKNGLPTLPSLMKEEKNINPFLRCDKPQVKIFAEKYTNKKLQTEIEVFAAIRDAKNHFILT